MVASSLPAVLLVWIARLSGPLHARIGWRLAPVFTGILFARGRQTVADGAYAKRPFLSRMKVAGVVVVRRLRMDGALWSLPQTPISSIAVEGLLGVVRSSKTDA